MGSRRGRSAARPRAEAGTAAGAELSRLFLDRSRHQPRSRPGYGEEGGRVAARRRLYHRQPRLGLLPARRLREGDRLPRKGDRAGAGRPDDQRPSRRRVLADRAARRGALPVEAGVAAGTGKGRGQADRDQARKRPECPCDAAARRVTRTACSAFAPAKVNLYLHVTGRRADGYHLLDSLIAFADIGDEVTAEPASEFSLSVSGPEAAAVAGLGDDNLVLRAARCLAKYFGIQDGAA